MYRHPNCYTPLGHMYRVFAGFYWQLLLTDVLKALNEQIQMELLFREFCANRKSLQEIFSKLYPKLYCIHRGTSYWLQVCGNLKCWNVDPLIEWIGTMGLTSQYSIHTHNPWNGWIVSLRYEFAFLMSNTVVCPSQNTFLSYTSGLLVRVDPWSN